MEDEFIIRFQDIYEIADLSESNIELVNLLTKTPQGVLQQILRQRVQLRTNHSAIYHLPIARPLTMDSTYLRISLN